MRKNWALVTGAVRSELYLRITMVKLCDMRAKGQLEGIVLSTWKGEIAPDSILKNQLTALEIKIVETEAIDINAEIVNNVLGLERQRVLIDNGLKIIPFDSFVIRLRTDFNSDIRVLFDLFDQEQYDDYALEYGKFPVNFKYKIYVREYCAKHIFYPNDRFFYGQREDLKKLMIPLSYSKLVNFHYDIEVELMTGYAFYTYPILRKTVDLLKPEFYEQYLFPYCKNRGNSELKIPRILLRAYATIFVYAYTHFKFLTDKTVDPDKCPLISIKDIFSGNIYNGYQIKKLIFGEVVDSPSMKEFQKELFNISLNRPECDFYTYEEYLELKEFVDKEIGNPELISEYPIVSLSMSASDESAGNILLSQYDDLRVTEIIQMAKNFNSVSEIYNKVKKSDLSQLDVDLICASIYDRGDNQAMNAYYIALLDNKITEDETFNQCIRYQILFSFRINCTAKDLVYVNFFLALLYCKKKSYKKVYDDLARRFPKRSYGKSIQYKSSSEGNAEYDLIKLLIKYVKEHRYDEYNVYIKKALCSILYFSKKYNVALNLTTDEMLTSISCIHNNLNCYATSDEMGKILYALVDDFNINTYLLEKNDNLSMEGLFDLSNILLMKNSFFSTYDLLVDTFGENLTNSVLLESFMYCAKNTTVRLFSLKFDNEIWFNYIPFCESEWNKLLDIPKNKQGQFWPYSENKSGSAYAAYIKIVDNAVFISIEFGSEPGLVKNNLFANAKLTGVDNFDANSQIIRLKVNKFPFKNNEEMGKAIGLALDEFSRIGDMLKVAPLDSENLK